MKLLVSIFILCSIVGNAQEKVTLSQKGWLLHSPGDCLAFLPIKDQTKTPTYKNFFTEDKGDGQRMNNNYSAPPKLLIAKTFKIKEYRYDFKNKIDTFFNKSKFYIQPIRLEYQLDNIEADTTDYQNGGCFWRFRINGKYIEHTGYYFSERSNGVVYYLNKNDSLFAIKGGRRKDISIYPPH